MDTRGRLLSTKYCAAVPSQLYKRRLICYPIAIYDRQVSLQED